MFFLSDAGQMRIKYVNNLVQIRNSINDLEVEENYVEFNSSLVLAIKKLAVNLEALIPEIFLKHDIMRYINLEVDN